jgi:hypothetical protein
MMRITLVPDIEGVVEIRSSTGRFLQAFRDRVAAGLLLGQPHPRSVYRVVEAGPALLRVRADDWWTAINVGLNEFELGLPQPGSVHYRVRFWRWALFAIGVSGTLGLIGLVLLLTLDVRAYIAGHQGSTLPRLSIEQSLAVAWAMVVFWGFAWPWLLIALHKRSLRKLVGFLISQVDARAASG